MRARASGRRPRINGKGGMVAAESGRHKRVRPTKPKGGSLAAGALPGHQRMPNYAGNGAV